MAIIRDLTLGRMSFPTIFDDLKESIGDKFDVTGTSVTPGEPQAKPFTFSVALHGAGDSGNRGFTQGDAMRRAVRSWLDNAIAGRQPLYMRYAGDQELNGWLLIGGGDIEYDGVGPALSQYKLTLTDVWRIGSRRTHYDALRITCKDLRTGLYPRDFLGTVSNTDFSAVARGAEIALPLRGDKFFTDGFVAPTTATGLVLAGGTTQQLLTANLNIGSLTGYGDGMIVGWNDPATADANLGKDDVVLYDRRGLSGVDEPSVEDNGTLGWITGDGLFVSAGSAITAPVDATTPVGTRSLQVVTGAANFQGASYGFYAYTGQSIPIAIWVKSNGTAQLRVSVGQTFGGTIETQLASAQTSNAWTLYETNYVATGTGIHQVFVRQNTATAGTWFLAMPPMWEEVYGPNYPLTSQDMPVMQNARSRVRWEPANAALVIDYWLAGGIGWFEAGRVNFPSTNAATTTPLTAADLVGPVARVMQWTPYTATVKLSLMLPASTERADVYVTLRHDWEGPKIECYRHTTPGGAAANRASISFAPTSATTVTYGRNSGTQTVGVNNSLGDFSAETNPGWYCSTGTAQIWGAVNAKVTSCTGRSTAMTSPYGDARPHLQFIAGAAPDALGNSYLGLFIAGSADTTRTATAASGIFTGRAGRLLDDVVLSPDLIER